MGKSQSIHSLSKSIASTALHRILFKKTTKTESKPHLKVEFIEYRDVALKKSQEFNWNAEDILEIKSKSLKILKNTHNNKYSDINISHKEAEKEIAELMKELF
jgi:hypothetical protein